MIQMISSLFAVLALIAACVFALKKLTRYRGFANGNNISIISTIPLGQKKSICLVRISNEVLIIGITNANMSLLTKMNLEDYYGKDAENKLPMQNNYPESIGNHGFRRLLSKLIQIKNNALILDKKR